MTSRAGATVTEVLIAAALTAVALGLVWGLVRLGSRMLTGSEEKLDARQQVMSGFAQMRRALQDASAVDARPSFIEFTSGKGPGEIRHDPATGEVTVRAPGESSSRKLPALRADSLEVAFLQPGLLRITLTVKRKKVPGDTTTAESITMSDDIFLPLIGRKASDVPWRPVLTPSPGG